MHSRRSVRNVVLVAGALALAAPSLAVAQDQPVAPSGETVGTATATSKDAAKKKKVDKKKKKKKKKDDEKSDGSAAEGVAPATVETTLDEGTPDGEDYNPSVIIAPGPTADGPGVVDNGTGGDSGFGGDTWGGDTGGGDAPVVPPPPLSPTM